MRHFLPRSTEMLGKMVSVTRKRDLVCGEKALESENSSIVQLLDVLVYYTENIKMPIRDNGEKDNSVSAKHY